MPRSLDLLFFLGFLLQANSFRLGDHGNSTNGSKSAGNYEKSTSIQRRNLKFELFGRKSDNKGNEAGLSDTTGNFITCVFTFDGNTQPEYVCKHSGNVKMEWHQKNEKLTGIFSMSPNCPNQESYDNEVKNRLISTVRKLELLPRAKRQDEAEEAEEAEEEESPPDEVDDETAGEEGTEEADVADEQVPDSEDSQQDAEGEDKKEDDEEKEDSTSEEGGNGEDKNDDLDDVDDDDDEDDEESDSPSLAPSLFDYIITPSQIWNYIQKITGIISSAGDYLLSLLLRNFKRDLYRTRMSEKFNEKVLKIANGGDGNKARAMRLLAKNIRKLLGESYQIELVKFLKKLADSYEL